LCSEVCDGHWVVRLVSFLHCHYHCTGLSGCTVPNRR
jgi:hypothetical protein